MWTAVRVETAAADSASSVQTHEITPPTSSPERTTAATECISEATSSCTSSPSSPTNKKQTECQLELEREMKELDKLRYALPSNIYSMLFLSPVFSSSFLFAAIVFSAKLCLYAILSIEIYDAGIVYQGTNERLLQAAQLIMMPVAVAIQEDLIESYALVANIRYDRDSVKAFPAATFPKWFLSYFCRMLDGFVSLMINYVLLLQAPDVLTLMLNFAALQFLQGLDDMAFSMGKNGYLTVSIEYLSNEGSQVTLPRKRNRLVNCLDTVLFSATTLILIVGWIYIAKLDSNKATAIPLLEEPQRPSYSLLLEEVGMMLE